MGVFLGSHIDNPLSWGLDFAMPATFLVLLTPLLLPKGSLDISLQNPYLPAGILAAAVAYKTRNILPTLGLSTLFMLGWRLI